MLFLHHASRILVPDITYYYSYFFGKKITHAISSSLCRNFVMWHLQRVLSQLAIQCGVFFVACDVNNHTIMILEVAADFAMV